MYCAYMNDTPYFSSENVPRNLKTITLAACHEVVCFVCVVKWESSCKLKERLIKGSTHSERYKQIGTNPRGVEGGRRAVA
jgi:hypothetical protein